MYTDKGGVQLGENVNSSSINKKCSYWLKGLDIMARETGDWDGDLRYNFAEFLISLELGGGNLTSAGAGRNIKNMGVIKVYGMERLRIEVPVCRLEEAIPN